MKNIFNYILPVVMLVPGVALAQFGEIDTFVNETSSFINDYIIPFLLAIAFLVFIVGVAQMFFVANDDNSDAKSQGKSLILWGIIAFVVIVSIWGIVTLISNGLGLSGQDLQNVPNTPS